MKLFFSLSVLLISISFLLFHSTSFTNAKIKNTATLSIVSEESALMSISYGVGKNFSVINNTAMTIKVDRVKLKNKSEHQIINNKKYGSRIIPVSQKINSAQKSMITLFSIESAIKIADEKELPVFFSRVQQDEKALYFIIDGDYLYQKIGAGKDQAYANS
ncbi:DUF5305 family protein [Paenisporosarcina antarctica]|uniref:Uncharacterized protein n=1 Tax=Paenisporosarcina antarctica TaxID=417367 RepID=A0A4P6ZZX1_9BACL|nr:DUF5305 family protein [Paenisporosarcina antarctica]QBP41864.1 hypothetical protein E2636_12200 [Paenisporosarcina antarctica]